MNFRYQEQNIDSKEPKRKKRHYLLAAQHFSFLIKYMTMESNRKYGNKEWGLRDTRATD